MQEKDNLVLIILSGIPCSGKSTWVEQNMDFLFHCYNKAPIVVVSKDVIRENLFGKEYKINSESEKIVNKEFYQQLTTASKFETGVIIVDNTHCKESFIDGYLTTFRMMEYKQKVTIYIKFFDIPLWKALVRNVLRRIRTGKWIPIKMMKILYKNYNKINKSKYKRFISNDF